MQNGGFVNKIQGVRLSVAKIHRHVFENPGDKVAEHINVKTMSWFFRYDRVVESLSDSPVDYTHLKVVW